MSELLETVEVLGPRPLGTAAPPRPSPLIFGELPGQELDRVLLSRQADLLEEVAVEAARSTDDLVADAFARATPNQRAGLLSQANAIQDFVDQTLSREFRLTGQLSPIAVERYGEYARNSFARFQEFERAATLAAETAARTVLPEVLVTGAGRALGVLGSGALGGASLIVEGAYELGSFLSDLSLRGAIARLTPPPIGPAPPDTAPESQPDRPTAPLPDYLLPDVAVEVPRLPPFQAPISLPSFVNPLLNPLPFGFTGAAPATPAIPNPLSVPSPLVSPTPAPTSSPLPDLYTLAPPLSFPTPRPAAPPNQMPNPLDGAFPGGTNIPRLPDASDPCNCGPGGGGKSQRKKKRKKKPREVCYAGTYVEKSRSLSKSPKRKVPCQ